MGAEIKAMFFTDKLRSVVSMLFMLILLVMVGLTWAFPRSTSSNLDEKSLQQLKEVSEQLKSASDNFEKQAKASVELTQTLGQTLALQKGERDDAYKNVLKRYGLDPEGMEAPAAGWTPGHPGPPPSTTVINVGVLPPDNGKRSLDVPPGTSPASGNRQLPHPAGTNPGRSDESTAPVPTGGPEPAR